LVEVFCAGRSCRNNLGGWPVRAIPVTGKRRDFAFYATKDRAMSTEASVGLMLWDCKSTGTLMNIFRLLGDNKKVVVHVAPEESLVTLRHSGEWDPFIARYAPELRQRIERAASVEASPPRAQAMLF
jgi:hypothetical protein